VAPTGHAGAAVRIGGALVVAARVSERHGAAARTAGTPKATTPNAVRTDRVAGAASGIACLAVQQGRRHGFHAPLDAIEALKAGAAGTATRADAGSTRRSSGAAAPSDAAAASGAAASSCATSSSGAAAPSRATSSSGVRGTFFCTAAVAPRAAATSSRGSCRAAVSAQAVGARGSVARAACRRCAAAPPRGAARTGVAASPAGSRERAPHRAARSAARSVTGCVRAIRTHRRAIRAAVAPTLCGPAATGDHDGQGDRGHRESGVDHVDMDGCKHRAVSFPVFSTSDLARDLRMATPPNDRLSILMPVRSGVALRRRLRWPRGELMLANARHVKNVPGRSRI
jgi:hypothetical protein